nr:hypothetical protein [Tanacetum cinerariifolium]
DPHVAPCAQVTADHQGQRHQGPDDGEAGLYAHGFKQRVSVPGNARPVMGAAHDHGGDQREDRRACNHHNPSSSGLINGMYGSGSALPSLNPLASQNHASISAASGAAAQTRYSRGYALIGQGQLCGAVIASRYKLGSNAQPSQRQALYDSDSTSNP